MENIIFEMQKHNNGISEKSDELTKFLTMNHFLQCADEIFQRKKGVCQIIYFNIRNFKSFNIEHGLQFGDTLLVDLARQIREHFRNDLISRFSADHFVVLSAASSVVAQVQALQQDFFQTAKEQGIALQAGIYLWNGSENVNASLACNYAKAAVDALRDTGNDIYIYDQKLEKKLTTERYIVQHIDKATEQNWIKVYFQPVVRTITGKICGIEALSRWEDPVNGLLSPQDFIPVLENTGLIYKLDQYVIREVCRTIRKCREEQIPVIPAAFNLSRIDFRKADMCRYIEGVVQEFGIEKDLVNIEITESVITTDPELMQQEIQRFRKLGYHVWMDDFGSGYSSLNVLNEFRFDEIKLDMGFLQGFDERSKKIIRSVIAMNKKLGIRTLAEGVETQEQFDFLRENGCEKVQGHLIGRPQPLEDFELLRKLAQKVESREQRSYYAGISEVNFMTDRALAIGEFDGEGFRFLFLNQVCKDVLRNSGIDAQQMIYHNMNTQDVQVRSRFLKFIGDLAKYDGVHEMECQIHGCTLRLQAECIGKVQDRVLGQIEITNISRRKEDRMDGMYEQESALRILDQMPCMTLIFRAAKQGEFQISHISKEARTFVGLEEAETYCPEEILQYVYPEDRNRVVKLIQDSVRLRCGIETEYRLVSKDGQIRRVHHRSNVFTQEDGSCVFYTVCTDVTAQHAHGN